MIIARTVKALNAEIQQLSSPLHFGYPSPKTIALCSILCSFVSAWRAMELVQVVVEFLLDNYNYAICHALKSKVQARDHVVKQSSVYFRLVDRSHFPV